MTTHFSMLLVGSFAFGLVAGSLPAQETAAAPKTEPWLARAIAVLPQSPQPTDLALKAGDSIVCIGDSITAGGGYLRAMDAVFAKQYPDLKIPKVINAGISGQKAENLIGRFQKDVVDRKPAVVTINIGINDVWHRLKAPHDPAVLAMYVTNVTKMVDMAQAAGIRVVLVTPTVIQEDLTAEGNKRLPLYVAAMKAIAAERKCALVDLHTLFVEALNKKPADIKGNWLTSDGVHMRPLGNAVMAVGILRGLGVPDDKLASTEIPVPPPRKPAPPKPAPPKPELPTLNTPVVPVAGDQSGQGKTIRDR